MTVAYALEQVHGVVVYAVDRKHDDVRSRERSSEHTLAVLYAAIVDDKIASRRFDQLPQRGVRTGSAAHINHALAAQVNELLSLRTGLATLRHQRLFQCVAFGLDHVEHRNGKIGR